HESVVATRRRAIGVPVVVDFISGSAPRCPISMTLFREPAMANPPFSDEARRIAKERTLQSPALSGPSEPAEERTRLVRSAWGITAWTFVSRIAGVLRDATIARFLGASALSDAFYTAFRIPNTFRAIVGEGGLPGAFVPMAKKVERERPGEEGHYA